MATKSPKMNGFSLIELLVTIAVSSIVLTVAVPSFKEIIDNNRIITTTNILVASLGFARSEAVKSGISVSVSRLGATSQDWKDGWQVFQDVNGDGTLNGGTDTLLKTYDAIPAGFTLKTGASFADSMTYEASGLLKGAAGDTFKLCDSDADISKAREIILNTIGRVYTKIGTTACP